MSNFPLKVLLNSVKSPIVIIGPDQRISMQNPAATELLNLDFTGRNYVTALRQPALLDAIDHARRDGTQKTARFIVRSGNADQTFEAIVVPESGQTLIILEDQSAEQDVNSVRRDFVANVSHELRTPLTALLGFIETLQGPAKNDPKAQERFLGIMATEADRLRRLVDDLLSLSRVEETERSRPTDPVDLTTIVGQSVDLLDPIATTAGTHLTVELPADPVTVPGDPAQLQQVLHNIIENAIKYGASESGITVAIHPERFEKSLQQDCVRITVQDHGIGIPARHLFRLTERFYRVDDHRDREMGGTGLGLAIVKHILNRHRGRLVFESVEGQGTTVTILLPVNAKQVAQQIYDD
ncbi:MAG: ATP-binding protein [Yoonia sp.]|uniref:sensor histidine kinase n=1 Tax=Yoonia sp. TaxID=2212373 RepID=UPI003265A028